MKITYNKYAFIFHIPILLVVFAVLSNSYLAKNKVNKAMLKVPRAIKIDQNSFSNLRSNFTTEQLNTFKLAFMPVICPFKLISSSL